MESSRTSRPRVRDDRTRPGLLAWTGLARIDGWLAFSALSLFVCSLFTLHQASGEEIARAPQQYVERQGVYGLVGIVAMIAISRVDYSRFRELRVGIYTFLCASIFTVFLFGVTSRGSTQSLELPFFTFQPAEIGKVLLVLSLAGFVIDGARRGPEVRRT